MMVVEGMTMIEETLVGERGGEDMIRTGVDAIKTYATTLRTGMIMATRVDVATRTEGDGLTTIRTATIEIRTEAIGTAQTRTMSIPEIRTKVLAQTGIGKTGQSS